MDTIADIKALFEDERRAQQADRELAIMEDRIEKAFDNIRDLASAAGPSLFRERLVDMQLCAALLQKELVTGGSITEPVIRVTALSADELVAIVYQNILGLAQRDDEGGITYSIKENTLERRIGVEIEMQARLNMMKWVRAGEKKPANNTPLISLATEFGVRANRLSEWRGKVLPACMKVLDDHRVILTGRLVLKAFLPLMQDLVLRHEVRTSATFSSFRITLRTDVADRLENEFVEMQQRNAALGFMVCEPEELTQTSYNARDRYITKIGGTKNVPLEPSDITVSAANATQLTRYTINTTALEALMGLTDEQRDAIVGITEVPTEANEGESSSQFASRVHGVEMSNKGKRGTIPCLIEAAQEALQFEAIYFPVYLDFRGRQYTVEYKGLGPQTTKASKALLQFAEGRPLGQKGLWWLYHELGNAMGFDKDLLDVKVEKARNIDTTDRLWFLDAEEPLKALAIQTDITAALQSGSPADYVSHQIVYVDGSCNGMQHLSLMTRDTEGGEATNVIGSIEKRNDLYGIVGAKFLEILEDDESIEADYWKTYDHKDIRKVVKRGVMTLPYGVTKQGIADQVISDGFCVTKDRSHASTQAQAAKFKDTLWAAVDGAAPKAMELRAWLIEVVDVLCSEGQAPVWITPTGTKIVKTYRKPTTVQVRVGRDKTNLPSYSNTAGLVDVKKNKAAIVANLIHSFDAAMLQDTMVRMLVKDVGPMSFVHDSYGTTAGDMDDMAVTLRESAVAMYSNDQLGSLRSWFGAFTEKELPPVPTYGLMSVNEVVNSPYFFA